MYAIIDAAGKQYKVKVGDIIETERLKDAKKGKVSLEKVLLVAGENLTIGRPYIKGAKVTASVLKEVKAPKVIAFKYRRRKGYKRTVGHRQKLSRLKIEEIKL